MSHGGGLQPYREGAASRVPGAALDAMQRGRALHDEGMRSKPSGQRAAHDPTQARKSRPSRPSRPSR